MKSSTRNFIIGISIIVIIGVAGGWLVFNSQADTESNTSSTSTTPTPTSTTEVSPTVISSTTPPSGGSTPTPTPVSQVKSFTISAQNYNFSTKNISANKGDTVKITLKSVGGTHDLVVDAFNAKTAVLSGGQEQTIQFVADKTGSFEFYCSVSDHKSMGMVGTLTVQ